MKVRHSILGLSAVCVSLVATRAASAAVVFATDFNSATVGKYADNTVVNASGANTSKVTVRSNTGSATTIVDRGTAAGGAASGNQALQLTDNSSDASLTSYPRAYSNTFGPVSTTSTGENGLSGTFDYTRLLTATSNATSPVFQFLVSSGGATSSGSGTSAIQMSVEANGHVFYNNGAAATDSGITLATGVEYTFAVDADFSNATQDTWNLTITPVGSATPVLTRTGILTRAPNVAVNIIAFTGGANAGAVNSAPFSQIDNVNFSTSTSSVPEPASVAVLGLAGLALVRRRRRR